jgi:hypothetical protein
MNKGFPDLDHLVHCGSKIIIEDTATTNQGMKCLLCKKHVDKAFLSFTICPTVTATNVTCFDCSSNSRASYAYVRLDKWSQFPVLADLLHDECRGTVEERAAWFEHHNTHPITFVQTVCPRETRKCKHCSKKGASKFCSKCLLTVYCDATCQKADWFRLGGHKTTCRPIREIFHIRSAVFGPAVKPLRVESNMLCTLLDGGLVCSTCKCKRVDEQPCVAFYKGFVEFRLKCRTCHTERLPVSAYGSGDIPFATTPDDFLNQLKEINKKNNKIIWFVL